MQLNDTWKIVTEDGGTEVKPGDEVTDFRGGTTVFRYVSQAPRPGSGGKIMTDRGYELYPSVFKVKIVPRSDAPPAPIFARFPRRPSQKAPLPAGMTAAEVREYLLAEQEDRS